MAWNSRSDPNAEWQACSARVDDDWDDPGVWYLTARRGNRWRVLIAGGNPKNRHLGELAARMMNDADPARWPAMINRQIRELLDTSCR